MEQTRSPPTPDIDQCCTGDPTGTGKGGRSIFATPSGKFPDELVDSLKHGKRGMVSMANSGANTNGKSCKSTLGIERMRWGEVGAQGGRGADRSCRLHRA